MTSDDKYAITRDPPASRFSVGEWIIFQEYLTSADVVMQILARDMQVQMKRDLDGEWPARSLIRRCGLRIYELRLLLNPEYLSTWELSFELYEQSYVALLWHTRLLSHRSLGRYSTTQIRDVSLMSSVFEGSLARSASQW
jgi:hypothetical protein